MSTRHLEPRCHLTQLESFGSDRQKTSSMVFQMVCRVSCRMPPGPNGEAIDDRDHALKNLAFYAGLTMTVGVVSFNRTLSSFNGTRSAAIFVLRIAHDLVFTIAMPSSSIRLIVEPSMQRVSAAIVVSS
eukprot:Polyplicarium_translucidae@DN933_c0_g1_i1.p2